MTKNEALKKCIDGAKVRRCFWCKYSYVVFDGSFFKTEDGEMATILTDGDDWQLYPAPVSFLEAWKAYGAGKSIKSEITLQYFTPAAAPDVYISLRELRGQWIILDA